MATTPTNSNHETVIYEHVANLLTASPLSKVVLPWLEDGAAPNNLQIVRGAQIRIGAREWQPDDVSRILFIMPVEVTLYYAVKRDVATLLTSQENLGLVERTLTKTDNLLTGAYHRGRVDLGDATIERTADVLKLTRWFRYHCAATWE